MIFAPPKLILVSLMITIYSTTTATGLPIPQSNDPDLIVIDDTARVLPIVNMPLATQFSAHQDENSPPGAVISSAFAYSNTSSLYPGVRVPPGWSFSLGLLHPFIYPEGTSIDKPLFHSASLADGAALPLWLSFDNYTVTFNGVTPLIPSDQKNSLFQVKLMASDVYGSGDVEQGFNLTVGIHTLDTVVADGHLQANVTAGYPTSVPWTAFHGIQLDGQTLSVENTSSIALDAKGSDWITLDDDTLDVLINAPSSMIGQELVVSMQVIDVYGDRITSDTVVQVEAYAFVSNETGPAVLGGQQFLEGHTSSDATLNLADYLSHQGNPDLSFELISGNENAGKGLRLDTEDGGLTLKGAYVPSELDGSVEIPMVIVATNRTSRATSSLSFCLNFTSIDAPVAPSRHHLSSGALAAIGAAIGIVCMMALLFLIYTFNKKKMGDLSMASSLSMRNSAILGPEEGIFSGSRRKDRFTEFGQYEREKGVENEVNSTNTMVEGTFFDILQPRMPPSSSSLVVRLGQSAENIAHRLSRVLGLESRRKRYSISKDMISRPTIISQVGLGPLSGSHGTALFSSPGTPSILPPQFPDANLLGADLFTAVTDIARRTSADSTSTMFTNFSKDTELWGKSDHEEESNFSQTPSHHRPSRLAGTPRSGGGTNDISPSIQYSGGSGSEGSPDDSPTPRRGYVQGRALNTITEDASKEGYSTGSSIRNPFGPADSHMSSIGRIQMAERTRLENATPEQITMGNNRHLRYGSDHVSREQLENEQRSLAASLEPTLGSSKSGGIGDVGSILNQTSFEGFKARDSIIADAEELEITEHSAAYSALHTSIASHTRSAHALLADHSAPRMISSRRTGSCSGLPVVTSSSGN
jgi:hypothetical protein